MVQSSLKQSAILGDETIWSAGRKHRYIIHTSELGNILFDLRSVCMPLICACSVSIRQTVLVLFHCSREWCVYCSSAWLAALVIGVSPSWWTQSLRSAVSDVCIVCTWLGYTCWLPRPAARSYTKCFYCYRVHPRHCVVLRERITILRVPTCGWYTSFAFCWNQELCKIHLLCVVRVILQEDCLNLVRI